MLLGMENTEREALMLELTEADRRMKEAMGIDPLACIAAAKESSRIRGLLRDDSAMIQHLASVLSRPPSR